MNSSVDDGTLDICAQCGRSLAEYREDGKDYVYPCCPECWIEVRKEWARQDLDLRYRTWRGFVSLVDDWFAEFLTQASDAKKDARVRKIREQILKYQKKLYQTDAHTVSDFISAVTTGDIQKCRRVWQPLNNRMDEIYRSIAFGVSPNIDPPLDPEVDPERPDNRISLEKLEQETPELNLESPDWIPANKKNEKKFGVSISTLQTYRSKQRGGRELDRSFGEDCQGRRWRRELDKPGKSTVFYYLPDLERIRIKKKHRTKS